ncbi:lipopolysaccharide biosynthesis protein [Roseateles asaccharophilus]|uniref:O-antigen/teichoic acid export membrane protein n=1 Tax=Roseateles asaccharophilus TaxID=582607 RepID=A0ABU2AAE0_9BURK|nr:lipopolysaccharide biosynthesis protein [Roseateles asaccharophilus]MDR7334169.1 O-antigen/teichoic acid export membrane protein [Roseateles asaccharophilus]
MSQGTGVRRALAFSFIERWLGIIIGLGSNVLLARLLTPAQVGIFSVSLSVIGVAQVLRDFGVVNYLIQEKDLQQDSLRTAYGLSLLLGFTLFAGVFAAAPFVAAFYHEELVRDTLRVCAINFLLLPFATVTMALMRREMAFRALAVIGLSSAGLGACVSVGLAWAGHGVMALAIGAVVTNATNCIGVWIARPETLRLRPNLKAWRRLLGFGAQSSLTGVVTSVSMDVNDLAVGKVMGFEPVAIISKAQGLMQLFHRDVMAAIRNVAYPAYAKAVRDGEDLEAQYLTGVTHVTATAWPFYGFVSLYALETLRLLFGSQWDSAAALVPWYCLCGAVAATANLIGPVMLAAGRIDLLTKVELFWQPLRAAMIVLAAVWFESMLACAIALLLALALQVPLLYAAKARFMQNNWSVWRRNLASSAGAALISLGAPAAIAWHYGLDRNAPMPAVAFVLAIVLCMLTWIPGLLLVRHPLTQDPVFQKLWRTVTRSRRT